VRLKKHGMIDGLTEIISPIESRSHAFTISF